MTKGLKALEDLHDLIVYSCGSSYKKDKRIKTIEKELIESEKKDHYIETLEDRLTNIETTYARKNKALVVLKDILQLKVYKNKLGQCFLEGTNILFPISQEEYDLLKEVLLDE